MATAPDAWVCEADDPGGLSVSQLGYGKRIHWKLAQGSGSSPVGLTAVLRSTR